MKLNYERKKEERAIKPRARTEGEKKLKKQKRG